MCLREKDDWIQLQYGLCLVDVIEHKFKKKKKRLGVGDLVQWKSTCLASTSTWVQYPAPEKKKKKEK
jgi:hypothetical protein